MFTLLVVIIILAFIFDFINGFHDAANSIATIVATKVLTPVKAVIWAAIFNFGAYFILKYWVKDFKIGDAIANAVNEDFITLEVILAGLIAAITWNLATWRLGIPSSSSHTLIGGFVGAALAHSFTLHGADINTVINYTKVIPILLFIFAAPLIGMIVAYSIMVIILNLCRKANPSKADKWFKRLQLVSSALFSLGHGANDAQKVMGIIGAAVIYYYLQTGNTDYINAADKFDYFIDHWSWVPFVSFFMIALGTLSGGWRIVKTMGSKITKVTSLEGVAAETAGAITLYTVEYLGVPVSTTHTITGSIIGVGVTKRISAVRWGVTIGILWAWILTIPVSAVLAGLLYFIVRLF